MRAVDPVFGDDAVLRRLVDRRKKARLGRDNYFHFVSNVLQSPAYAQRQGVGGFGGGMYQILQGPFPKIEGKDPPKGTEERQPPREEASRAAFRLQV